MKRTASILAPVSAAGFMLFLHGYLSGGWWLYPGLVLFLAPMPVLLALVRIWSMAKRLS